MKYYRDTYAEHPEDRENIEYGVRLHNDESLVTLTGMYDQMRQLGYDLRYARYAILPSIPNYKYVLLICS